ncbi:hypothetical protein [Tepidiphilus succinatimandens]|jgi:hypothetical protein|uniref:Uncharacterized protein n=1 Tax=Tepidiphilus thermophilus TaxID=876478 RepID=A0A0K6IX48_9PROT|nr:hypothetical protein [Tepidiphilus succinatimandens]CUB07917.1 hypothetical protein Ga0061068_11431 [Tepidiphilus thermophilus]
MEGTAQPYRLVVPLPRYSTGLALALVAAGFVLSFVYFPWPKAVALAVAFVAVGIRWHRSCSATKALWLWPGHHLAFAADDAPRHRTDAWRFGPWVILRACPRRGGRGATYLIELPSLSESDRWALAHWCATGRPPRS